MAKKNKAKVIQMLSPENYIRQKARTLPILECLVNNEWEETGLANIMVARKHTNGNITMGMFLVDLKCLGIKNAFYRFNISESEYRELLGKMEENMDMESISYTLAHNIVYAGIEFAEEYSLKPHKDFSVAKYILEEDTDDIELIEIECGKNEKPLYVQGPLDNDVRARQIIAHLEKHAGPGNYHYILTGDNNNEPEEDGIYDDLEEEFGDLPVDQKISMIEELAGEGVYLSQTDQQKLAYLSASVIREYIDPDKTERLIDNLLPKLQNLEVVDEPFDELAGIDNSAGEVIHGLRDRFVEIYDLIGSNPRKANDELEKLSEKYPENPGLCYLELLILQSGKQKEYENKTEEYYRKFPGYPLIKIEWATNRSLNGNMKWSKELFRKGPAEFFQSRIKLHSIELFQYLMLLAFSSATELNISCIHALGNIIEEIELEGTDYQQVSEIITMGQIDFILTRKEKLKKQ